MRKRIREEENEEAHQKLFKSEMSEMDRLTAATKEDDENSNVESSENDSDNDESPADKFRRGCDLPSDLDMGSNCGSNASTSDDQDDGDWTLMGAALEREFLGLE